MGIKINELLTRNQINEELRKIPGTKDYITPTGKIYLEYKEGLFFKRKNTINKNNGYTYSKLTTEDGKGVQRRVHRLVAMAYIPNDNNYPIVMHINNDKSCTDVRFLKWGTMSENTRDAYKDGLAKNKSGFDDNQSVPIAMFDLNGKFISVFGSIGLASKETGVTKTGILYQCNHKTKSIKSRCHYYFRFYNECLEKGFIL